jgi:HEAT repeat protein
MLSVFDGIADLGPAGVILDALLGTVACILLLLLFILLRRARRSRYFRNRNRRVQEIREIWEDILNGDVPASSWFSNALDYEIVEGLLLEAMDVATPPERDRLQRCLRNSGLFEKRFQQVYRLRGWRRREAMLALGRMRLPESIPALAEALSDSHAETVVDAIRGLGRVGSPEAAEALLKAQRAAPLPCPPQLLQSALFTCYQANPSSLFAQVLKADDRLRPILARTLAEVPAVGIQGDVIQLARDPLAEVRAQAARILAAVRPPEALSMLTELSKDKEWFVRLRAAVALGELRAWHGIPVLMELLCDTNRFVRLRAAAALVRYEGEEEKLIHLAMETRDRYALQALVSEMQRSGRIPELVRALNQAERRPLVERALLAALEAGSSKILVDLLLHHPNRHTRASLARLLARSGNPDLLRQVEQLNLQAATRRQQRYMRWLFNQLQTPDEPVASPEQVLAV